MALDYVRLCAVLIITLVPIAPGLAHAGGVDFNDENSSATDNGPAFFGFVREADGHGVAGAKVSATLKGGNSVVTSTDILGIFKIPGVGKDINPDDVTISCAKDGYTEANVLRRPRADPTSKNPIEVECYLQKQ